MRSRPAAHGRELRRGYVRLADCMTPVRCPMVHHGCCAHGPPGRLGATNVSTPALGGREHAKP
eukprot:3660234-Prymnesium_polylepis.1